MLRTAYKCGLTVFSSSADEDIDSTFPTNVVVSSDGSCQWVPPGLFLSTCKIDIKWFPFDDQKCKMKFGSWTYDGSSIDLQLVGTGGDISSFIKNGEWELIGAPRFKAPTPTNLAFLHYCVTSFTCVTTILWRRSPVSQITMSCNVTLWKYKICPYLFILNHISLKLYLNHEK